LYNSPQEDRSALKAKKSRADLPREMRR
jgi:hypothetical protein